MRHSSPLCFLAVLHLLVQRAGRLQLREPTNESIDALVWLARLDPESVDRVILTYSLNGTPARMGLNNEFPEVRD